MRLPIGHQFNSNFGPILPRFRDIAGFLRRTTPSLFHPNFRGVPLGVNYRCCGSEEIEPTLIIHVINFELVQPVQQSHRQTDRQTDGRSDERTDDLLV